MKLCRIAVGRANTIAELRAGPPLSASKIRTTCLNGTRSGRFFPIAMRTMSGLIPFFPLAGGFLTGKYKRDTAAPAGSRGENSPYVQKYMTDANYDKVEAMTAWAAERGLCAMVDLAHAWLLGHPAVCSVISGATKCGT
ncbi:MAG: aldo/keto reductase [Caldilineaceae bacterium]